MFSSFVNKLRVLCDASFVCDPLCEWMCYTTHRLASDVTNTLAFDDEYNTKSLSRMKSILFLFLFSLSPIKKRRLFWHWNGKTLVTTVHLVPMLLNNSSDCISFCFTKPHLHTNECTVMSNNLVQVISHLTHTLYAPTEPITIENSMRAHIQCAVHPLESVSLAFCWPLFQFKVAQRCRLNVANSKTVGTVCVICCCHACHAHAYRIYLSL